MNHQRHSFGSSVFRLALVGVLLLTFTASLAPPRAALADPANGTGPGGVGNRLGSSTLRLWLRADAGLYTQTDCTVDVATDGNPVGCWQDQSGYVNHVTAPTNDNRPTYESDAGNALNGKPVLQFGNVGGINRYLQRTVTAGNQTFTLITVSVPGATTAENASIFASAAGASNDSFQLDAGGGTNCSNQYRIHYTQGISRYVCAGSLNTAPRIVSARVISNSTTSTWNNGTIVANNQGTGNFGGAISIYRIGMGRALGQTWPNNIAEVILYYQALNTVQRTLVENYLQAKYNNSAVNNLTISNDRYNGDTAANGNFDLDVAGIGQESDGSHTHAHSAGMIVENSTFLSNNGDYLLFGHQTPVNNASLLDLPSGWGPSAARWYRHWYIQVTDINANGGTVTIQFDFDEADIPIGINPAGSVTNYHLLRRPNPTGQFSDIATATSYNVTDRTITFSGVDVSLLASNFTLGTLDNNASPIGGTPTAVDMAEMTSAAVPGGARLTWTTAQEIDTVMFKLYRAEAPEGEWALLKELQPRGMDLVGATYVVEDLGLTAFKTYYYRLEVVNLDGIQTFDLTPVTAWGSIFLPLLIRAP